MFVSGFTIVRNAIRYDYPIVEAIQSILPICDEVIVLVGNSEDNTLDLIQSIGSDKIKIHHSVWDDTLREGGKVLAIETNKAKQLIHKKADWCFYIQADEVFNTADIDVLRKAMEANVQRKDVEGLLFHYKHFFGNFNYVAKSRDYYRKEIRVIKNLPDIESYRDAQGFRRNDQKLKVIQVEAEIFHYGWVRHPEVMKDKIKNFHQLWHDDAWIQAQEKLIAEFDYTNIDAVELFTGKHPSCMEDRIQRKNWDYKPIIDKKKRSLKAKFLFWLEEKTGYRLGEYKNYTLIE